MPLKCVYVKDLYVYGDFFIQLVIISYSYEWEKKFEDFIYTFTCIYRVLRWPNNQINCGSFNNHGIYLQTFISE